MDGVDEVKQTQMSELLMSPHHVQNTSSRPGIGSLFWAKGPDVQL